MTVDQSVYDLCKLFLEDDQRGKASQREIQQLAERVQDTIEDEISNIVEMREKQAEDDYWDAKIQAWKDGEIAVNGHYRGEQ